MARFRRVSRKYAKSKTRKVRVPRGTPTLSTLSKRHAKQRKNLSMRQKKERASVMKIRRSGEGRRYRTRRPARAGRRQRR